MVREDLSLTQKEKFVLQAKVSELKNNMKTLLQQNQQLRLDLRRGVAKTVLGLGALVGFPGPVAPLLGRWLATLWSLSLEVLFSQCGAAPV